MNKNYLYSAGLLIVLGVILAFLPAKNNKKEVTANKLLLEIIDETRFVSTDEVAKMLINKDPSLQLIDVRTPEEYAKWSLPSATNIPLANILNADQQEVLNQEVKKTVLVSNGTVYANQAWVLLRRLNTKNIYVMKGGLNEWIETIMKPTQPVYTADSKQLEQYEFRKAASSFFGGGSAVVQSQATTAPTQTTGSQPIKKKEKKAGGGC